MHPATGDGGESLTVQQQLRRLAPEYLAGVSAPRCRRGSDRSCRRSCAAAPRPWAASSGRVRDCPGFHYRYHSCNDRHCPQCGQTDADAWLQRQRARLLLAHAVLPGHLHRAGGAARLHPLASRRSRWTCSLPPAPGRCRTWPAIPAGWARSWGCSACSTPGVARSFIIRTFITSFPVAA